MFSRNRRDRERAPSGELDSMGTRVRAIVWILTARAAMLSAIREGCSFFRVIHDPGWAIQLPHLGNQLPRIVGGGLVIVQEITRRRVWNAACSSRETSG